MLPVSIFPLAFHNLKSFRSGGGPFSFSLGGVFVNAVVNHSLHLYTLLSQSILLKVIANTHQFLFIF